MSEFSVSTTNFDEVESVETWKKISTYPDYEVSDMGRVRCIVDRKGHKAPFLLTVSLNAQQRPVVTLRNSSGQKSHRVDEIVLEAFVSPRPDPTHGPRPLNGDKQDVRADNLMWMVGLVRKSLKPKQRRKAKPLTTKVAKEIRHGHWLGMGNVIVSIQPNQVVELTVADAPDHHSIPLNDLDDVISVLQAARTVIDG